MQNVVEHEIIAPVDLSLGSGRLNKIAVGWSRHRWHNTDQIGRGMFGWGRNKRWEYWGIVTPTHLIGITASTLDYATLAELWVYDRATGVEIDRVVLGPLSRGVHLPGTLRSGPATVRNKDLSIDIEEVDGGTHLRAKTDRVSLDLIAHRPRNHEALGVVVPWSWRLFQYTVKDVALRVDGNITVDGTEYDVPLMESWAVLDHGRGRWPYSMTWNWGAGSGEIDGQVIGLQLGGKWTDGTGSTENSIVIDGTLHKISEELDWEYDQTDFMKPWRIIGERVDVTFTPFYERAAETNAVIIASKTRQCFGHYAGTVTLGDGTVVTVDGLIGWAEHVENRW
ncbi:DUF2804 domain-containing protein [Leifsonia sp. A12D58]|uniref:DUF2804 domain-containing protein n=1 Tax=Leifsonia sp. A12D58 TaxID=3397674 RepID=UPI0039E1C892